MTESSSKRLTVRAIVYIAIMGALGTAAAILSIELVPLGVTQITLDLSHLGTFLVAIPGGALLGAVTGAVVGIYPGIAYGFTHGQLGIIGLVSLPFGKALTGLFCGLSHRYLKRPLVSITISYVPENIFTIWLFAFIVPILTPWPAEAAFVFVMIISVKAWIEILFMAFVMETVFISRGIVQLVKQVFPKWDFTPLSEF